MTICENCRADAVDADGVCANCGWQASASEYERDDAISLGETRVADVQTAQMARGGTSLPYVERTSQMPHFAPGSQPAGRGSGMGTQTTVSRYCGSCGARISAGEAFCGQCGTPVGTTSADYGAVPNMPGSGAGRYQVGSSTDWPSGARDEPTEAFVVSPLTGYARGRETPYGQAGYGPNSGAAAPVQESSRGLRVALGVLCLVGSLGSAVAAVILATQH